MDIKTGVIGIGSMGQHHARVYNQISNLVAIADPDENLGRKAAKKWGVKWYRDYKEMLPLVDAVTVAVPTSLHYQVSKDVIQSGVHLLVEKPLAGCVEEAEKIVALAKSAGIKLAAGHIERFNPVIGFAKKKLEKGEWGKVITLSAKRLSSYPIRINDVGVLFDLSIHDVDIIRYLAGSEVNSIIAVGGSNINENFEDYIVISMKFKNSTLGLCETNWLTPKKVREINITTDFGYISINMLEQKIEIFKRNNDTSSTSTHFSTDTIIEQISLDKEEPLKLELEDFLNSIENNKEPLVSGEEGLEAVKTIEAAVFSLKYDSIIKI